MTTDALETRMARLEGAFEQVNERLGAIEGALVSIRVEGRSDLAGLRAEVKIDIGGVRSEVADLRRQVTTQFYWLLTFVLGSILVPLLRDLTP